MNGVVTADVSRGWPAIAVIGLSPDRVLETREPMEAASDELLLLSVSHAPRIGETRSLAALMPQVLARYGLAESNDELSAAAAYDKMNVS